MTAELDFNVKNLIEEKYDPNFLNQVKSIRSRQELTNKEPSKVIDLDQHVISKKSNAESKGILNNIIKKSKNKNILNKNAIGTANDTWANNKVMYGHKCKNSTTHSEATVNYELNHTVVHTKLERGTIKRLSIAVVVNYIKNAHGKLVPLNVMQIDQIKKLTQAAVGYSEARGDTVSIVNSLFFKPKINDVNVITSTNNILVSHVYLKRICLIFLFIVVICFLSYLILAKIFRNRNINKINHLNNSKFDNDDHLRQNETKLNQENKFFNNEYNLYSTQYNSIQDIEKLREYDSEVIAKIIKYWMHKSL
ncbi:hypothetical protein HIC20_02885 [Buchnera aphidicola (Hormaphis cornu)]|nr:hypothetical protein HIC20_02885 [Buchnera aphidicola (Hormaphis cornu)]